MFEREGYRTQRTGPGDDPVEGFQFSLGHGVGLQVHEDPGSAMRATSRSCRATCSRSSRAVTRNVGGVRFEDLLVVTDDGYELLTSFPYGLTP